jgi:hypothetical protein
MQAIKCSKCGQDLITIHWSGGKEITMCDNDLCLAFHNPISDHPYEPPVKKNIAKESFEDLDGNYARPRIKPRVTCRVNANYFARQLAVSYTSTILSGK